MSNREEMIQKCIEIAHHIRKDQIELTFGMGNVGAHIGGGLSLTEIMAVLYGGIMNISNDLLHDDNRDRLIFSKGHGTLALYPAMKYAGIITDEQLQTYKKNETILYAHPSMNDEIGIEFSSGSLGQGLPLGVGVCLGLMRKNNNSSKVYVILGDGECDEGSVWEAAQSASHFGCKQLITIVDCNELQYDGPTDDIMSQADFTNKWKSFGFHVENVDGHDVAQLWDVLSKEYEKPTVILAKTIKGKGVSFMENNPLWHNHSLTQSQYEQAMKELEGKA